MVLTANPTCVKLMLALIFIMKITLPLVRPVFDDNRLSDEVKKDFENGCQILIYKAEHNLQDEGEFAFGVWIEYAKNNEKTLMFDVRLDDVEMFANSLLKSVKMFRRDYKDVISAKIENGDVI